MPIWAAIIQFFAALFNLERKKEVKQAEARTDEVVNAPRTDDEFAKRLHDLESRFNGS